MDETITWVAIFLIATGILGIFLTYSGISKTFESGLQAVAALSLVLGLLMLPGGLARGGIPSIKMRTAAAVGITVSLLATGFTVAALVGYGPFGLLYVPSEEEIIEAPFKVIVSIIPGSYNPEQTDNYVPKNIRVVIGINNTVIWVNNETLEVSHTVTSVAGIWDSGYLDKGEVFKYTFRDEGLYNYFCIPHPWMRGSVESVRIPQEEVERIMRALNFTS